MQEQVPPANLSGTSASELEQLRTELDLYRSWVKNINVVLDAGAAGDMERRLLKCHERPDLEALANSVNRLLDNTDAFIRESSAALNKAAEGKYFRKVILRGFQGAFADSARLINHANVRMAEQAQKLTENEHNRFELAEKFENEIIEVVCSVSNAAKQLQETAGTLAASASHATEEANSVAQISEQSSKNVSNAVQATACLEKALQLVERNVDQSTSVSVDAVGKASFASDIVKGLSNDSTRIGGVVKIISQVADQTNLLALNATIEAARAGEVGKGFAVVASEVKNLAKQTGDATQQISTDIEAVKGATANAVEAISGVGETIDDLKSVSEEIVLAIKEQKQASIEIGNVMKLTEEGCTKVSRKIEGVSAAASKTNHAADQFLHSAKSLSDLAAELNHSVQKFLRGINL